jgi:SAM-dependent methyltransferase
MAKPATDFEDYARWARSYPYFYRHYRFPDIYYRALGGLRGTYADVGAGDGIKLRRAIDQRTLGNFSTILAIELSRARAEELARYLPEARPIVADAASLPFEDAFVDFLFCDQVIEHVPSDIAVAEEIHRVLRSGGRALVGSVLKHRGGWYFHRNGGHWRLDPTHVREYSSQAEYHLVFTKVGLRVIDDQTVPIQFPVSDVLLRLLMRAGLAPTEDSAAAIGGTRIFRMLSEITLTIPRYSMCYATVERYA